MLLALHVATHPALVTATVIDAAVDAGVDQVDEHVNLEHEPALFLGRTGRLDGI